MAQFTLGSIKYTESAISNTVYLQKLSEIGLFTLDQMYTHTHTHAHTRTHTHTLWMAQFTLGGIKYTQPFSFRFPFLLPFHFSFPFSVPSLLSLPPFPFSFPFFLSLFPFPFYPFFLSHYTWNTRVTYRWRNPKLWSRGKKKRTQKFFQSEYYFKLYRRTES